MLLPIVKLDFFVGPNIVCARKCSGQAGWLAGPNVVHPTRKVADSQAVKVTQATISVWATPAAAGRKRRLLAAAL
jgi:hypothetical protein